MTDRPTTRPDYDFAAEYSGKAAAYARDWAPVLLQLTRPLLAVLPLAEAQRILDVGSGSGGHFHVLRSAAPGATVYGADIALGMLQEARKRANAQLVVTEASRLAVRTGAFDVALSTFVFQHVDEPALVLREMLRTLRPGGAIGLATWGSNHTMPGSEIWVEELDRAGAGADPRPEETFRELVDTPDKVEGLLQRAGFNDIRAWAEIGNVMWRRDDLISAQATVCSPSRRLRTLAPEPHGACLSQVQQRIAALPDDDLVYRPEIVLSVARRPA